MGAQLIRDAPEYGQSEQADYLLKNATRPVKDYAELVALLDQKTLTELGEFIAALQILGPVLNDAKALDDVCEEAADVMECLLWRIFHRAYRSVPFEHIQKRTLELMEDKRARRGGHEQGLVLVM